MDIAIPQLQQVILGAIPAYEAYLLQVMGRPFPLKLPVMKPNPDNLVFTFESVNPNIGGYKTPERILMKVEYLRSMKMATLRIEYWPDIAAKDPKAVNEPNLADSIEHLMSPHFVFGWLKTMAGSWAEGVEPENMAEARMQHVERIIVKADEVLAEYGYVIEANDYESYANTLDTFLLSGSDLPVEVRQELEGIGDVVRKVAHAAGVVKGIPAGLKQRWSDFKGSVAKAFQTGKQKGFEKGHGKKSEPEAPKAAKGKKKSGIVPAHPIAATAPTKLKSIKGGKASGPKKDRHPGGKMTDKEYKSRYGSRKRAEGLDGTEANLEETLDEQMFEAEFTRLNVPELEALETMTDLLVSGEEMEEGAAFKALVGKLKARGGVRNPAALAAWIGRKKYGAEKFAKMSAAGRKKHHEGEEAPAEVSPEMASYRRFSGIVSGTGSWKLP